MMNRTRLLLIILVLLAFVLTCSIGTPTVEKGHPPAIYVPPGQQMFQDYCAACHGLDGKGRSPLGSSLTKRPVDLTTLAKRNSGTFPTPYVTDLLRFGPRLAAHSSSEMPVWGPIFQYVEHSNEAAVRQRIKNLCGFLESIQEK